METGFVCAMCGEEKETKYLAEQTPGLHCACCVQQRDEKQFQLPEPIDPHRYDKIEWRLIMCGNKNNFIQECFNSVLDGAVDCMDLAMRAAQEAVELRREAKEIAIWGDYHTRTNS